MQRLPQQVVVTCYNTRTTTAAMSIHCVIIHLSPAAFMMNFASHQTLARNQTK